jgi:hypothetical protein
MNREAFEALAEQIYAFLADAPKGKPHTGYRYGELLEQAAAALRQAAPLLLELKGAHNRWHLACNELAEAKKLLKEARYETDDSNQTLHSVDLNVRIDAFLGEQG